MLEGLLEYERTKGPRPEVAAARLCGQEYLLERRLFRSRSTGQVINPAWTQISFPTRWHYDILWGLDYLRRAGVEPESRTAEAVDLIANKRDQHGRWPLENPHAGTVHFEMEGSAGEPSRWNTLRALRVLGWADKSRTSDIDQMHEARLLNVGVECYAGHRGEQTPRTLILGDRRIDVAEVLDAWLAPDHRYFKLRGADGNTYLVRHDEQSNTWELTMFRAGSSANLL